MHFVFAVMSRLVRGDEYNLKYWTKTKPDMIQKISHITFTLQHSSDIPWSVLNRDHNISDLFEYVLNHSSKQRFKYITH